MLAVLKEYDLIPPIVQLCAALIALLAVILTQRSFNERQDKDIHAKIQQADKDKLHEKELKKREMQLLKIEEIFELVQMPRENWALFLEFIMKFDSTNIENNTIEKINERIDSLKKESRVNLMKVDLLAKIHISEEIHLCVMWKESLTNIKFIHDTSEQTMKKLLDQTSSITHRLNLLLDKLVQL